MQVKDLTVQELKAIIRETVIETLGEYLEDADKELELKEDVKQQLLDSLQETESGVSGIPAEEVANKLGLEW
ncbi:MAG: hypothetical protein QNJ41_12630 [Xenococcaceae cyanobacterium MO_188.B32]|nr:hypothetical protein [Xenococcaceae cyanobacterium MO_188.B32]